MSHNHGGEAHDHGGKGADHEEKEHSHGGGGHHHHAPADFGRAFMVGIILNTGFIVLEVIFGIFSQSLALVADAGHNLADVLGLVLAWVASEMAKKTATARRTYGWRRGTVVAALFNALLLLVGVGGIVWEALGRIRNPEPVAGGTVIWVAALGILINGVTAMLFLAGRKNDLNVRGAFIHMAADAGVSAGVMISGAVILFTGWLWLDSVVSLAVAFFILLSTWELFKDSLNLSLDAVPESIDPDAVQKYLKSIPEVSDVHHMHIWPLSTTDAALTVHLVKKEPTLDNALTDRIREELHHEYGIEHVTIQFEAEGTPLCADRADKA